MRGSIIASAIFPVPMKVILSKIPVADFPSAPDDNHLSLLLLRWDRKYSVDWDLIKRNMTANGVYDSSQRKQKRRREICSLLGI
mmetsp:Transcript_20924/g.45557  ORF Transcript_20924/g.45557 Transcript_20924/m.45557 type:complete len:84 (+) Transcript_20924:1970-2221(+)